MSKKENMDAQAAASEDMDTNNQPNSKPEKTVKTVSAEKEAEETTVEVQKTEKKKSGSGKGSRRGANTKALELEIQKQKDIAQEYQDKYKRLLAEFENARTREAAQATKMYDIGAKEVLEKLLPVVDNFERALDMVPEEDKSRAFESGVEKIYKQLMVSLEGIGVKPMNAEGKEFDPNLHNAVLHVEDENFGENTVAEEMQKGYMYKDAVLRHSMVKVAN